MNHRTQLIILNTTKVGERSLVLHALSPDWGRRSFITSIPKGGRLALFQPLSVLDAEVSENPRSELWRVHGLSAKHPLSGIRTSPSKNAMILFMSEVLWRTLRDGTREDGLFEWCERAILTLVRTRHPDPGRPRRRLRQLPPPLPAGAGRGARLLPLAGGPRPFRRHAPGATARAGPVGLQCLPARPPERRSPRRDRRQPAPLPQLPYRNPHRGTLAAGITGTVSVNQNSSRNTS